MAVGRRAKAIWWHENINEKLKRLLLPISLLQSITFCPFQYFSVLLSFKQGLVYSHSADGIVNGYTEVSEMVEKWGLKVLSKFAPHSLSVDTGVYHTSRMLLLCN